MIAVDFAAEPDRTITHIYIDVPGGALPCAPDAANALHLGPLLPYQETIRSILSWSMRAGSDTRAVVACLRALRERARPPKRRLLR